MKTAKATRYLLDVNLLIALVNQDHVHHATVRQWFYASPSLQWAMCAFTEAGFLRYATAPHAGQITMNEATSVLQVLTRHTGYQYLPITADWQTLCSPFFSRLHGTRQVTDAFLLGLSIREDLVLATMDKAIVHLAGPQYAAHVLLLRGQS